MPGIMKKRDIKLELESLIASCEDTPSSNIIFSDMIAKDLQDLRTYIMYMKLDIEALRRERDYWLKKSLRDNG